LAFAKLFWTIWGKTLAAARTANPRDFMDARFIQELDKSGYIDGLYR